MDRWINGNLASYWLDPPQPYQYIARLQEELKVDKAQLGPDHPNTLDRASKLAAAYLNAGELFLAQQLCEGTLQLMKAKHPNHPEEGRVANCLNFCKKFSRKYRARLIKRGAIDSSVLSSRVRFSDSLREGGLGLGAEMHTRAVLEIRTRILGPEHLGTIYTRHHLAWALGRQKNKAKQDEAIQLEIEVLAAAQSLLGDEHRQMREYVKEFSMLCRILGRAQPMELKLALGKKLPKQR